MRSVRSFRWIYDGHYGRTPDVEKDSLLCSEITGCQYHWALLVSRISCRSSVPSCNLGKEKRWQRHSTTVASLVYCARWGLHLTLFNAAEIQRMWQQSAGVSVCMSVRASPINNAHDKYQILTQRKYLDLRLTISRINIG